MGAFFCTSDCGCRLRRLSETLAKGSELLQLIRIELRIAICHIRQRGVEPLLLIVGVTSDNTALHDMLEQFVAGFLIR